MKIAITCGGTGGHVFPGVATAAAIVQNGHEAAIVLSGRTIEGARPEGWNGPILHVPCPPPHWRHPVGVIRSACRLAKACLIAIGRFRRYQPDALLAMGSYTSVPTVLAARLLGIPIVLHEANVIPGAAISRLRPLARMVCVAFEEAATHFPAATPIRTTGLPVRKTIAEAPTIHSAPPARFTLLVMGGSQGATALNQIVTDAIRILADDPREAPHLHVIHLAGAANETAVREAYAGISSLPVDVIGFTREMGECYAAADFCLSRAGAASCFELCLRGLPAALIPLPAAARNHQMANARTLERLGGCDVLPQPELTPGTVADYLRRMRRDEARRDAMRRALLKAATPQAADTLAKCVVACAQSHARGHPR